MSLVFYQHQTFQVWCVYFRTIGFLIFDNIFTNGLSPTSSFIRWIQLPIFSCNTPKAEIIKEAWKPHFCANFLLTPHCLFMRDRTTCLVAFFQNTFENFALLIQVPVWLRRFSLPCWFVARKNLVSATLSEQRYLEQYAVGLYLIFSLRSTTLLFIRCLSDKVYYFLFKNARKFIQGRRRTEPLPSLLFQNDSNDGGRGDFS